MTGLSRYHAPPVSYPAGRFVWGDRLAILAWWVAAVAWGWGVWSGADGSHAAARVGGVLAALGLAGAAATLWRQMRRWPVGTLAWQSGQWTWQGDVMHAPQLPVHALRLVWDGQAVMYLRLEGPGLPRWVCLTRQTQPALWDDLRRAVWAARSMHSDAAGQEGGPGLGPRDGAGSR